MKKNGVMIAQNPRCRAPAALRDLLEGLLAHLADRACPVRRQVVERHGLVLLLVQPTAGGAAPYAEVLALADPPDQLPSPGEERLEPRRVKAREDPLVAVVLERHLDREVVLFHGIAPGEDLRRLRSRGLSHEADRVAAPLHLRPAVAAG